MSAEYLEVIAGVGKYLTQFAIDGINGVPFDEAYKKVSENSSELSQLRADLAQAQERIADIESIEHCPDCGGYMVIPADAPDDAVPFCPFCRCEQQAAQLEQARELFTNYRLIYLQGYWTKKYSAWLAANPAPEQAQA